MQVTHNGLDAMVRRLINEMTLLAQDSDDAATYLSPRYDYMAVVGTNDLYTGLQVGGGPGSAHPLSTWSTPSGPCRGRPLAMSGVSAGFLNATAALCCSLTPPMPLLHCPVPPGCCQGVRGLQHCPL